LELKQIHFHRSRIQYLLVTNKQPGVISSQ
jgi:hypothetical protein